MRFIKFLLFIALSTAIFSFITLLNLKIFFTSPDFTKKLLRDSNAYSLISVGIRDNLSKTIAEEGAQDALSEVTGDALDEMTVQGFLEDIVDRFFIMVNSPAEERFMTVPYSAIGNKITTLAGAKGLDLAQFPEAQKYLEDKDFDFSKSPLISALANIKRNLLINGGVVLLLMILMLLGGSWGQKMKWLSFSVMMPAFAALFELLFYFLAGSTEFFETLAKNTGLEDQRFILGFTKVISIIWNYQKTFYIVVTSVLFFVSIFLLIIARLGKTQSQNAVAPSSQEKKTSTAPTAQPSMQKDVKPQAAPEKSLK